MCTVVDHEILAFSASASLLYTAALNKHLMFILNITAFGRHPVCIHETFTIVPFSWLINEVACRVVSIRSQLLFVVYEVDTTTLGHLSNVH